MKECEICKRTEEECKITKCKNMLLCPKHKSRLYRNQDMYDRSIYDKNDYIDDVENGTCKITLYDKNGNITRYAIIDLEDKERCIPIKWYWYEQGSLEGYVRGSIKGNTTKKIHLHRFIMSSNRIIDHINHNGLDNRKCNLREVTQSQNAVNRKNKYAGICKVPSGRYQLNMTVQYKRIYFGTYDTIEEAYMKKLEVLQKYFNL